jgi:hypothetical protein
MKLFIIVGAIAAVIAGMILTLARGILVDRTRARNKQLIMDHYGGLTGWPREHTEPASSSGSDDRESTGPCGHSSA